MCIALACCEKYTYDVRLNIHTFVHVVSEAPGVVFQKNQKCVKRLLKFVGMWGIDNRCVKAKNELRD